MITASATKTFVASSASGAAAAVGVGVVDQFLSASFGVSAVVVILSFIGAFMAVAYSDPIRPWVKFIAVVVGNSIFGIIAALNVPLLPWFAWIKDAPPWTISFSVAFFCLWTVPVVISRLPGLGDKWIAQEPPVK